MTEPIYGLLGRTLGHSWSVPIHTALGCPGYHLIELEPDQLGDFLRREEIGRSQCHHSLQAGCDAVL